MTFFIGKDSEFLRQQTYENYNGYLASVYPINSSNNPKLNILDLKLYPFEGTKTYNVCVSTSNKHSSLISKNNDFIVWHTTNVNPIVLSNIIKHPDWIKILNSQKIPITIFLKDEDSFYLYRNSLGFIYYDKNLNISTKQFYNCKLLEENTPFLIDFNKRKLIPF